MPDDVPDGEEDRQRETFATDGSVLGEPPRPTSVHGVVEKPRNIGHPGRNPSGRRLAGEAAGGEIAPSVAIDPPQLTAVTRDEVIDRLEAALRALARPRAVAVRMYLAGYPREEIAALMGWSEAKTRNLLYRGLADLRSRLEAAGISPESVT